MLGVQPTLGRTFSAAESEQRQRVAVVSHRFWQSRFAGSPDAIGAPIVLDGIPSEIIGVLPERVDIPSLSAEVWEPHTLFSDWDTRRAARGAGSWFVFGRLRPNVTINQAQEEMATIARSLDTELPAADRRRGITVVPLTHYVVGPTARLALWMLTGAVFCVLLIAAANVVSLSLARTVGRLREFGLRASLGATAARMARQILTESTMLAALAGGLGTVVALVAIRLIRVLGPGDLARLNEVNLDPRVVWWTVILCVLTGILVGAGPAIMISRGRLRPSTLGEGRGMSVGGTARGIRRSLIVVEFALAIILLASAGLLVRSWVFLSQVDRGFDATRVLSMNISTTAVAPSQRTHFYAEVLQQVESVPGVECAGIIGDLFVSGDAEPIVTTGGDTGIASRRLRLRVDEVSERLFTTLRAPLLSGRFFSAQDGPDAPRVAIVNQTMARRLWRERNPLGMTFKFGSPDSPNPWITVVGVVADMRRQGLELDPIPQVFAPFAQRPSGNEVLLVRTSTDRPLDVVRPVQAAIRRVDKQTPIYFVTTLEDLLDADLAPRRLQTSLLIVFSIVALLMSAVGIYGLVHYSVATRTQEIGIRMAVGARAGDIFRMVVREGLQLSIVGLLLGLVGAYWVGAAGSTLLFGVTVTDPLTLATVSLLLTAVAASACYFPAQRAMRVEPVVALQQG
jgi:predicted permease